MLLPKLLRNNKYANDRSLVGYWPLDDGKEKIAFDNKLDPQIQASGSTQTVSFTTSGKNRVLLVGVLKQSGQTVTGVTYAGVAMTQVNTTTTTAGGGENLYLFILVNPALGANNIVATFSSSTGTSAISASSYTGVQQTGQPNASNTGVVTSNTSLTTSVTTTEDYCWLAGYARSNDTMTAGANTYMRSTGNISMLDSNGEQTPVGSKSMNTTQAPASFMNHMIVALKPAVVIKDYSSTKANGTPSGAVPFPSQNPYLPASLAYKFDGVDDYIDLGTSAVLNPSYMSFFCWVELSVIDENCRFISRDNAAASRSFGFGLYQNKLVIEIWNTTNTYYVIYSVSHATLKTLSPGVKYFVGFTYDGSLLKTYVNGICDASLSVSGGIKQTSINALIGKRNDNALYLNGKIQELSIFNRALSQKEISGLYEYYVGNQSLLKKIVGILQNLSGLLSFFK